MCQNLMINALRRLVQEHESLIVDLDDIEEEKILERHKNYDFVEAFYKKTNQKVYIKRFYRSTMKKRHLIMFIREVNLLSTCKSQFINSIIGFSITDDYSIITSACQNGTLLKYIKNLPNPLDGTEKMKIIIGVAFGVAHLHRLGFICRDLKLSNIYLDEKMCPKIYDLGYSRPISQTHLMTRKIGTVNMMAPELLISHEYDSKVDVYSFGMFLYQFFEHKLPYEDLPDDDLFDVIINSTIELQFIKTPNEIRDLIHVCIDKNPLNRPTFESILQYLYSGKYLFPGADLTLIQQYIDETRKNEKQLFSHMEYLKPKKMKRRHISTLPQVRKSLDIKSLPMPINAVPWQKETEQNELMSTNYKGMYSFISDELCDILVDAENPLFYDAYDDLIENLVPSHFDGLYATVKHHFFSNNTNLINHLMSSFSELMKKSADYTESICRSGFFELPCVRDQIYKDYTFPLITHIMLQKPKLILPYVKTLVKSFISLKPHEMILVFSHFIKNISNVNKFISIIDVFMQSSFLYSYSDHGRLYLRALHFLFSNYPELHSKRFNQYCTILMNFLKSDVDIVVKDTYYLICHNYDSGMFLPYDMVFKHIQKQCFQSSVFSLLLRLNKYPVHKRFIDILIQIATTSPKASLILMKIANQQQEAASVFLNHNASWFIHGLYTSVDTFKLLLIILKYKPLRSQIQGCKEFAAFIARVVQDQSEFAVTSICAIFSAIHPTPGFIKVLETVNFLDTYFIAATRSDSIQVIHALIIFVDLIAQIGYTKSFLIVIPRLNQILLSNESLYQGPIVSNFVSLSYFSHCIPVMQNYNIYEYFLELKKENKYSDFVERFFINFNKYTSANETIETTE